ncbi:MAG: hypothetical protein JO247_17250 [Chloroflexi bacterium]|nr:hypothetical protein [Chloroflexota bacterium]
MAEIVLGIGTSHTPMLSLTTGDLWAEYAKGDRNNQELVYPPNGVILPYDQALEVLPDEVKNRPMDVEHFDRQAKACQAALDKLSDTLHAAKPDITVIVADDQDEWLFEDVMPAFTVFWGDSVPLRPRTVGRGRTGAVAEAIVKGYGDVPMDIPVPSAFGRHIIESLMASDFDVAHMKYVKEEYSGKVTRRYPTPEGESSVTRDTPPHEQGLPHGYSFVVKRLFNNEPSPILPVMQNTCYPPNVPSARRCFAFGQALAQAIESWHEDVRVAVVASGGLSHFVVDEELDHMVLRGLQEKDEATLTSVPRHKLYSAASESLNWVTLGGVFQQLPHRFNLVDYVPVYRTPAMTGGGWAFGIWK